VKLKLIKNFKIRTGINVLIEEKRYLRNPISFIGLSLGAIFLVGAGYSHFYHQRYTLSKYFEWYIDFYPYRQYTFFLLIIGIVFLVVGLAYSSKQQ